MNQIKLHDFTVLEAKETPDLIPAGVKFINADNFWDKSNKGDGRTIAILDTGCDIFHPDLADRIIGTRNFTSEDGGNHNKVTDYVGHGTHVAGIIAANDNKSGIIGVAPKANLLIIKVLERRGGSYESLVNGVNYAISKKVDVINMSLGGGYNYPPLEDAIKKAVSLGISVVCAAGNEGDGNGNTNEISYPAYYVDSISVGSMKTAEEYSRFSNSNAAIDLIAPGEEVRGRGIYSTAPGGRYVLMKGTSMACPHVAGAIALIKNWAKENFKRELSEQEIYAQLIKMTKSLKLPKTIEGNGYLYLDEI